MSDMKLRIENGERFYYPDVMLVCNENDDHSHYKDAPYLIAEVLSPSTDTILAQCEDGTTSSREGNSV